MELKKELRDKLFPVNNPKWGTQDWLIIADLYEMKQLYDYIKHLEKYKYWGEILENTEVKMDELQEYLISNQQFEFAQSLKFERMNNKAELTKLRDIAADFGEEYDAIRENWKSQDEHNKETE